MLISKNIYTQTSQEAVLATESSQNGLSQEEASIRLELYGKNVLEEDKKRSLPLRIFDQIKNPMILILIAASIISGVFGEWTDMIIILLVVAVNTALGIIQEGKADKAIAALKQMSSPHAKVMRDGKIQLIPSQDVVLGDIVELEAGDSVCADLRLITTASLKIEEAVLTGESMSVEKNSEALPPMNAPLGDRINMAYSGTSVVYGRGSGVVTSIAMGTEMGKIAASIIGAKENLTPIQKKLNELSKILTFLVIGVCVVVFGASLLRDGTAAVLSSFLMAVSLAVAAIPEGLAAVVTIVMALGVQRMAEKNAIIRKLPAVETLGCTQVICSDKTGTLTQNRMTVTKVYCAGRIMDEKAPLSTPGLEQLVEALSFCNDSAESTDGGGKPILLGDPTETALIDYAVKLGYDYKTRLSFAPRRYEFPFDSARKLMSTFHQYSTNYIQCTKGAPDVLIERCDRIMIGSEVVPFTAELRAAVKEVNAGLANQALRVLAAAICMWDDLPVRIDDAENGMVFLGLVGMIDPARSEVKDAVAKCVSAGIRPVMITGDHKVTATAIARELGILDDVHFAITGDELDRMSDADFDSAVSQYSVYARVAPEHKARIIKAWQKRGKVVAMTGDGVNDAPALKTADIGIGMGITGTEVTKGVADMVLTDDNFATIVIAVEEGRAIYSNIKKCIHFLLSCNLGEVISVLVATLLGQHLLSTIHILWINLISDTFPALALGIEKPEKDIMNIPPRGSEEGIFSSGLGVNIFYQGILLAAVTLTAYFIGLKASQPVASTMAFCTLTFAQMLHSLNVCSSKKSILKTTPAVNRLLLGSILLSIILTAAVVMIPGLNTIFKLQALSFTQWLTVFGLSVVLLPIVEIVKLVQRKK